MTFKIKVENLSLNIPIISPDRSFRTTLRNKYIGGSINRSQSAHVSVSALKDISFTLHSGDRLALIGHNGAGKTTLLNVLAGIYKPLQGKVICDGSVTPLFNCAPGMDRDDTGLENIRTICTYFGMSEAEIKKRTPDIIEFTELEDFINLPVRTYSSGMQARLSFAVATSLQPDILLLDEGISVGDQRFAHKAKLRLQQFYNTIDVMICASHSNELLRELCNKAMLLEHGSVKAYGTIDEVLQIYTESQPPV
jgi:ABC-type polysaccharide/polyol phosphate transport system ATPase subunit